MLGVFFTAGIHPSRTWISGSFESVRWNACQHRLDLGLYSHPKEFIGNGVRTHVNSQGKNPLPGNQRWIEPMTLHEAQQQAPYTTNWAIPVPTSLSIEKQGCEQILVPNPSFLFPALLTFWKHITDLVRLSFSFCSRKHGSAQKGPYVLHPVFQQSLQSWPRNSASVWVVDHRSFTTSEGGMLATSFLHSSCLQVINVAWVKLLKAPIKENQRRVAQPGEC